MAPKAGARGRKIINKIPNPGFVKMSVFKTRVWWSTHCGEESFDQCSLIISKLNTSYDHILVGSHAGYLRIFQPSSERLENNLLAPYKPTDNIAEIDLDSPVLQVTCGKFTSGSQQTNIAVLHPRKLSVYTFIVCEGITEHGKQISLNKAYEHGLRRSAMNLVAGEFGGVVNRDFICVQSLDGVLSFFEQESLAFCCFLPQFLLPGPFVYVKRTDSFVVYNSNRHVESYRYKELSETGHASDQSDTGKKAEPNWSFDIGEVITDMVNLRLSLKDSVVLVLGERNLFCFSDTGKLKFMKRFDFTPSCFHSYLIDDEEPKLMILVVAETNTLLVYEETTLLWAAQLDNCPISISRASFENVEGVLVSLTDEGELQCFYLGTQPYLFNVAPSTNQDLDFDKAEEELERLNRLIKSSSINEAAAERELNVNILPNPHLEECPFDDCLQIEENALKMCSVKIEVVPNSPFEEVQVLVLVEKPFVAEPCIYFLNNVIDKVQLNTHIYVKDLLIPSNMEIKVVTTYLTKLGIPRVNTKSSFLPTKLILETCSPSKESLFKLTLNINQNAIPLSTLYPEFSGENSVSVTSPTIGLKTTSGVGLPVTILLAKSSQRYRIQSDSLSSMGLVIKDLERRLQEYYKDADFEITFSSALPIQPLQLEIDKHYAIKEKIFYVNSQLIQLSAQFRMIQKRLIAKFKDKHPTPLTNLDILLEDTYGEIIESSQLLENLKSDLSKSQSDLQSVLDLFLTLVKFMDIPKEVKNILEDSFMNPMFENEEQGWEETMDITVNHLLKTTLLKSEKDKLRSIPNTLERVKDISKLKKHVSQIFERATKGITTIEELEEIKEDKDEDSKDVSSAGSRLGILSARAASAKSRTTQLKIQKEEDVKKEDIQSEDTIF